LTIFEDLNKNNIKKEFNKSSFVLVIFIMHLEFQMVSKIKSANKKNKSLALKIFENLCSLAQYTSKNIFLKKKIYLK